MKKVTTGNLLLPLYFRGNDIPQKNSKLILLYKKLSNCGKISQIERKNHYLQIQHFELGRKNHYSQVQYFELGRKNHYSQVQYFELGRKNHYLQVQNSNSIKQYSFLYSFSISTILNFSQKWFFPSKFFGQQQFLPSNFFDSCILTSFFCNIATILNFCQEWNTTFIF